MTASGDPRPMRSALEWASSPRWIEDGEDPPAIVAEIQREAFLAGVAATLEQLQNGARLVARVPSEILSPRSLAAVAATIDPERLAGVVFGQVPTATLED